MKKFKIAISLFAVIAMLATMLCFTSAAAPASSTVTSSDGFNAVPYADGVYLTWSIPTANNAPQSYGWYEIAVCEEEEPVYTEAQATALGGGATAGANVINESQWGMNGTSMQKYMFRYCFKLDRNSHSQNNTLFSRTAFINEDSVLNLDANFNASVPAADRTKKFANTPGKTYYFYILGHNGGLYYALGRIVYTVPSNPTLSVESDGLTNTLTYTLNKGKDGAIYRYDSQTKAEAGGDDYDKKISVSYGGAPVTDTVTAGGNYYYVLKQDVSVPLAPASGTSGTNDAATVEYGLSGVKVTFNLLDETARNAQCVNIHTYGINTCKGKGQAGNANYVAHDAKCPGAHNDPFVNLNARIWADGVTDNNMNLLSNVVNFTLDGTETLSYEYRDLTTWGLDVTRAAKLMPGVTYNMVLTQTLTNPTNPNAPYQWSYVTVTAPMYLSSDVKAATNEIPTIDSWITDATVVSDGLVNLTFGDLPSDTGWSEIAIYTEDKGALGVDSIDTDKLPRPGNHSVYGQHKEGTVGANGDFAYTLVDGTTYYIYVIRTVNGQYVRDHLIKPFEFTYIAPQVSIGTTTETTTVTTTETATTVPTSAPSSIPSDDPNRSGDISLVLYAVTALTAGGAIVAIKRKKA